MTERPVCLRPDDRLDIARALMVSCAIRHLPVEDSTRKLVGVVTSHDLLAVDLLRETEAREVMSAPAITVSPGTPSVWALHTLVDRRISCLPVVDEWRSVGIVTLSDFVRAATSELVEQGDPPVSTLMSPRPISSLRPDDALDVALLLMKTDHVRHLPVIDGEHLVGMVTDHDLIRVLGIREGETPLERNQRAKALRVREVMAARVISAAPQQSAAAVGELLRKRRIGAVPLVRGGRLVGIVSSCDYFQYLLSVTPPVEAHS